MVTEAVSVSPVGTFRMYDPTLLPLVSCEQSLRQDSNSCFLR